MAFNFPSATTEVAALMGGLDHAAAVLARPYRLAFLADATNEAQASIAATPAAVAVYGFARAFVGKSAVPAVLFCKFSADGANEILWRF